MMIVEKELIKVDNKKFHESLIIIQIIFINIDKNIKNHHISENIKINFKCGKNKNKDYKKEVYKSKINNVYEKKRHFNLNYSTFIIWK